MFSWSWMVAYLKTILVFVRGADFWIPFVTLIIRWSAQLKSILSYIWGADDMRSIFCRLLNLQPIVSRFIKHIILALFSVVVSADVIGLLLFSDWSRACHVLYYVTNYTCSRKTIIHHQLTHKAKIKKINQNGHISFFISKLVIMLTFTQPSNFCKFHRLKIIRAWLSRCKPL